MPFTHHCFWLQRLLLITYSLVSFPFEHEMVLTKHAVYCTAPLTITERQTESLYVAACLCSLLIQPAVIKCSKLFFYYRHIFRNILFGSWYLLFPDHLMEKSVGGGTL